MPGNRPALADDDRSTLVVVLERSRDRGFLGPGPVEDHIDHALRMAEAVGGEPAGLSVDLGAGGGIPGLVLALAWPTSRWTLIDASLQRTDHLSQVVQELALGERVAVRRQRAEEAGRGPLRHRATLVVARSFGPPAVTAECAAPLLVPGGLLVVSEPPETDPNDRWPAGGLDQLGLVIDQGPTSGPFVRLRAATPCPERFPRRVGVPSKRPLF